MELGFMRPVYNVSLTLRFQMDNNCVDSAAQLRDLILSTESDSLAFMCDLEQSAVTSAEVETRCSSRTTTRVKGLRDMTREEAERVEASLRALHPMFWTGATWKRVDVFSKMEHCWFRPFSKAVSDMCAEEEAEGSRA